MLSLKNTIFENIKQSDESFDKHFHDTYIIGITYRGVFKSVNEGKTYHTYRYTTRVLNPYELHGGFSSGWSYTNFYPKIELLVDIYEQIFYEKKMPIFGSHIIDDFELFGLLNRLFLSVYQRKDTMEIETNLIEALSYLIKNYTQSTKEYNDFFDSKKVIKHSLEYIHDSLDTNISLEELAREMNISKYHFLRVFKNSLGITPHNYIIMQRLHKATKKILEGSSISQASIEVGFNDQSHFSRYFKKIYGYTPKTMKSDSIVLL